MNTNKSPKSSKSLIVVESPSKGKTIQEYLGDDYIVIASMGHIMELGSGGFKGIGVDVENNFKTYYNIMNDKIELVDRIIDLAQECKDIYLFSDADREGECIANHIYQLIKSLPKKIKRASSIEITKTGVKQAIENARDIDLNLVKAQETRRVLDRIIGYMVSPYLMTYYGNNLSAGRVQSVAVRMIVDREKEINNFKPEEYYTMIAEFLTSNNELFSAKYDKKLKSKEEADQIKNAVLQNPQFFVSRVDAKEKKEKPKEPLITSKLQQLMAKKFHLEPEQTMQSAQVLYESGYCTYIRTDSVNISEAALVSVRDWLTKNNFEIPKTPNVFTSKKGAQDAHECIRPTNINNTPDKSLFTGNDKLVYEAIWKSFVSCQMTPAVFNTLDVQTSLLADKNISFRITGKAIKDYGYLKLLGEVNNTEINIPNLQKNEKLQLNKSNINYEQRFTKPPARYNVAALLDELEAKSIGRPATYAQICKTITNRNYVENINNVYKPTELGIQITDKLTDLFDFMEYNYCAEMENKLDEIAEGKKDYLETLNLFFSQFKQKLFKAYSAQGAAVCDNCGYPITTRKNKTTGEQFSFCLNGIKCKKFKKITPTEKSLI